MIDNRHLRGIILKLETRLSDDDRTRLHFFLGNDVPRRIRDDASLRGTLNVIESLFDQDKINENDFTFLINAFDEIQCMDAVKILREHMRCIQSPDIHQSVGSLSLIMPPNLDLFFENAMDDKYTIGIPLLCQSKNSDSSIDTIINEKSNEIPVKEIVNNPSSPPIPQKSFIIRKYIFVSLLSLSVILLCTLTAFIIIQSNRYTEKVQINEKIILTEQGKNTQLINELNILNSRINQTQKQLIIELTQQNSLIKHLNHSRMIANQTIIELHHLRSKDNSTMQELLAEQKLQHEKNEMLTNQLKEFSQKEGTSTRMIQELHHLRLKYNQTKQQLIIESQQASNEQKRLNNEIVKLQALRAKDRDILLELKERVEKFNRSDENRTKSPRIQIKSTTQWKQHGSSVAKRITEENEESLGRVCAVRIDDDGMMIIADCSKHCVWEWTVGALSGNRIAGDTVRGNGDDQLKYPTDVIIDQKEEKLIICDRDNRRVARWPRRNGRKGETIISNVKCFGIAMDVDRFLYVSDIENHEVRRWKIGESTSELIAGGNQAGSDLKQLNHPHYLFITPDLTLFICDWENHRVMKWTKQASEGIVVAGGSSNRNVFSQLYWPEGIFVDQSNSVYIADCSNNRVLRVVEGSLRASPIVGGNLQGNGTDQFYCPMGFTFDSLGNLYVADAFNFRVQKFDVEKL